MYTSVQNNDICDCIVGSNYRHAYYAFDAIIFKI